VSKDKGVRYWTRRAEDHALGILASCDDESFWGLDVEELDGDDTTPAMWKAREIVMNRIRKGTAK